MSVVELNAEAGVGQNLGDETLEFQEFFFWHVMFLLNAGPKAGPKAAGLAHGRAPARCCDA